MKTLIVLSIICFSFISNISFPANELFRSVTSGNWNSNSTWEMFTGGSWIPATSTPDNTSNTITVQSPNTVTVTVDVNSDQLIVDPGGQITINTGITLTVLDGSGNDLNLNSGGTISGLGTLQTQGANVNISTSGSFNAHLKVTSLTTTGGIFSGAITVDPGGQLDVGSFGNPIRANGDVTNNGTIGGNSSSEVILRGSSLVNNGTIQVPGLKFDSTTSISGTGTYISTSIIVSGSGNVSLSSNVTFSHTQIMHIENGGILNPNGNTFTLKKDLELHTGGTVASSGTFQTQGTISLLMRTGSNFNAHLKVDSGLTSAGNTTSLPAIFNGPITVESGANFFPPQNYSIRTNNNIINNGIISAFSASVIVRGSSLVNNGSITASSLNFDSTTSLSGTGTFTSSVITIGSSGNISLSSNVTFSPGIRLEINPGGILNPNLNIFTFNSGTFQIFNGGTVSNSGTFQTQSNVLLDIRDGSSFNAPLKVNTGTTSAYNPGGSQIAFFNGTITVDAGTTLGAYASNNTIRANGNVTNNGLLTSGGGGTFVMCGSTLINNGTINPANFNFDSTTLLSGIGSWSTPANILSGSIVSLGSNHQMSSVVINSGGTFNISSRTLKLSGSGTPLIKNGTLTTTGSTIEYNGTASQSLTSNVNYANLRINNPAGVTVPLDFSIPGLISVINGDLDLNGKVITLLDTARLSETPGNTVKGNSPAGYITTTRNINTPNSLNIAGLGAVITSYTNLGLTQIIRGHSIQTLGGTTSIKRYYIINPQNNTALNATFKFKYDSSELDTLQESSLGLYHSTNSGTNYTFEGGNKDTANNEITLNFIQSFSKWTAARDSQSVNLDSVIVANVYAKGKVPIRWGSQDSIGIKLKIIPSEGFDSIGVEVLIKNREEPFDIRFDTTIHFHNFTGTDLQFFLRPPTSVAPRHDNLVVQAIPGELSPINGFDIFTYCLDVTCDAFNYIEPCDTMDGGTGFVGRKGRLVSGFTNSSPTDIFPIDAVDYSFFDSTGGNKPYKIAIYADNGSGKPGNVLYTSPLLTSPLNSGSVKTVTHEISPSVNISPGAKFYVGFIQTSTNNIKASFQSEIPIRSNAFFFSNSDTNNVWFDFADSSRNFRMDISARTSTKLNLNTYLEGFYDNNTSLMVPDTVGLEVRSFYPPYSLIEQDKSFLNSSGSGIFNFLKVNSDSSYYFVITHRNHIETWSHGISEKFNVCDKFYDFTDSISKAFGSNMIQVDTSPLRFGIYGGDANQDGLVDLTDGSLVDNDSYNFVSGYVKTDLNGDGEVDIADAAIADNNTFNFVSVIKP